MKLIEIAPPTPKSNQSVRSFVSDDGRAFTTFNNGTEAQEINGLILFQKNAAADGTGYVKIKVRHRDYYLHRLIAEAFVPNPKHSPVVNHIDGKKQNNAASNLEWLTYSENTAHAVKLGLIKRAGRTELWCMACDKPAVATWCVEEFDDRQVRWKAHRQIERRKVAVAV